MQRFLEWLGRPFSRPKRRLRTVRPARPALEQLEDRQLLSGFPTDMTAVARQFAPHRGPTILYLNFDGGDIHYDRTWYGSDTVEHVTPFQPSGQDRDQAVQDILFRVSEMFTPFNVEVERLSGAGNYSQGNGNTTVFIGGNDSHWAFTPASSSDYPSGGIGASHAPNSDPYDVAFVDPAVGLFDPLGVNGDIAQAVAHEAGHTFGLAHVRTDMTKGLFNTDPAPLGRGTVGDLMSYNTAAGSPPRTFFADQTLPITDFNFEYVPKDMVYENVLEPSMQPTWNWPDRNWGWLGIKDKVPITTQNSYTYLQAALGPRAADAFCHVADLTSVDPAYRQVAAPLLTLGAAFNGAVTRPGDYDVFQFYAPSARQVTIRVDAAAGSALHPTILIYDATGQTLLASSTADGSAADSVVQFQAKAGMPYKVVVGGEDGVSSGNFHFQIGRPPIELLWPTGNPPARAGHPWASTTWFGVHDIFAPSPLTQGAPGPVAVPAASILGPAVHVHDSAVNNLLASDSSSGGNFVGLQVQAGHNFQLLLGAEANV
jgi:hypothetical protein